MSCYGIYGYETTKETEFDGFKLRPRIKNHIEVEALSSDLDNYNLTGFLEINDNLIQEKKSFIFDLQGVLSFIDQKNVIIANPLHAYETFENLNDDYPRKLTGLRRINGGGKVITSDVFSASSRGDFITKTIDKLKDLDAKNKAFRGAFFKSIEVFRGSNSFIDVNYYLLFSALESLSRTYFDDFSSKNASTPISKLLELYGFDISQDNIQDLDKSVSTYTRLRNSLFHNGKFECEANLNGKIVRLELMDYYPKFKRLIPLVLMKYIGFDDNQINWNSWLDRMPFK